MACQILNNDSDYWKNSDGCQYVEISNEPFFSTMTINGLPHKEKFSCSTGGKNLKDANFNIGEENDAILITFSDNRVTHITVFPDSDYGLSITIKQTHEMDVAHHEIAVQQQCTFHAEKLILKKIITKK